MRRVAVGGSTPEPERGTPKRAGGTQQLPKRTSAYNHFCSENPDRKSDWNAIKKANGAEFEKYKQMERASHARYQSALKAAKDVENAHAAIDAIGSKEAEHARLTQAAQTAASVAETIMSASQAAREAGVPWYGNVE
eukprot:COSAG01_NODE_13025_length_1648_cov_1.238864_2_plen_137_part_00